MSAPAPEEAAYNEIKPVHTCSREEDLLFQTAETYTVHPIRRAMLAVHTLDSAVPPDTHDQPAENSNEFAGNPRATQGTDDQRTGNGAATALSKMRMIEPKESEWQGLEFPSDE